MKIMEVRPLPGHRLFLRFDDGKQGHADLSHIGFRGVFASWRNQEEFAKVWIEPEFGTVAWPSGAELDTYVLYSMATGAPLPGGAALPDWTKSSRRRTVTKKPSGRGTPPVAKSRKAPVRRARAS
jgi:hypothetical protein